MTTRLLSRTLLLVAAVGFLASAQPAQASVFGPPTVEVTRLVFDLVWGGADDGNLPWPNMDRAQRSFWRETEAHSKAASAPPAPVSSPAQTRPGARAPGSRDPRATTARSRVGQPPTRTRSIGPMPR